MKFQPSTVKLILCVIGLALAFWCGRATSPEGSSGASMEKPKPRAPRVRTSRRGASSPERNTPSSVVTPGAGQQAIKSALQLREIFKKEGTLAAGRVQLMLSRMSGDELSDLAADIVDQQLDNPGYSWYYEVQQIFSRWAEVDSKAALAFANSFVGSSKANALTSVFGVLARKDSLYAYSEAKKITNSQIAKQVKNSVLHQMATREPDAWLATVLADPQLKNSIYISNYVSEWAMDDPAAAIARIQKLPKTLQKQATPQIARVWAGKDAAAALKWAQELEPSMGRSQAVAAAVSTISTKDPDSALQLLDTMPAGTRKTTLAGIFSTLATKDFDGALQRALSLTSRGDQHTALGALIGNRWQSGYGRYYGGDSHLGIEELSKVISNVPNGSLKDAALSQIGQKLRGKTDVKAQEILSGYQGRDRETILKAAMHALSSTDPKRAINFYHQLPKGSMQSYQYGQLLGYLAKTEPDEALTLALEMKTSKRSSSIGSLFSTLSSQNPEKAARQLERVKDEKTRLQAISYTASNWSNINPDAAVAWASKLPIKEQRHAMSSIIPAMANNDPERASQMLNDVAGNEKDASTHYASAASSVASSWANIDPTAAAAWVRNLSDTNIQNSAVYSLMSSWASRDPEQAGQWVDTLPDGKNRDRGVSSLVNTLKERDPEAAFGWANTIANDSQRASSLDYAVRSWKTRDPEKARAAVQQSNLTEKERESLMRNFPAKNK